MSKSNFQGFSLVEVLIAGSLAFLILGICYLLYAEGFDKSVRLNQMSQRISEMSGLRDLLLMDARASSEAGIFVGDKGTRCALFGLECSRAQLDRLWATEPVVYGWSGETLQRFSPNSRALSTNDPKWKPEQFDLLFSGSSRAQKSWSKVRSFTVRQKHAQVAFLVRVLVPGADGREREMVLDALVEQSL